MTRDSIALQELAHHVIFLSDDDTTPLDAATMSAIPTKSLECLARCMIDRHGAGDATISVHQDGLGNPLGYRITYFRQGADTTKPSRENIIYSRYETAEDIRIWQDMEDAVCGSSARP